MLSLCFYDSFKTLYAQLRELKTEIEHIQHLLEKAKVQLQKDFEQWWSQQSANLKVHDIVLCKYLWLIDLHVCVCNDHFRHLYIIAYSKLMKCRSTHNTVFFNSSRAPPLLGQLGALLQQLAQWLLPLSLSHSHPDLLPHLLPPVGPTPGPDRGALEVHTTPWLLSSHTTAISQPTSLPQTPWLWLHC